MDFFESQDTARRNTGKLILLFVLAVISLVLITNILFVVSFGIVSLDSASMASATTFQFDWQIFAISGTVIFAIVLIATLYRISSLSGGGARIAEMMNGRLLVSGNNDLHEQRVLNVVEEMAIASGTPVPPVYVMEEAGINAFAAGYAPSDAVIGITRGAIETLNRDQLQGVIAHEFSHILHGDMRINIRLIGVLFGIMVLGQIGYYLLRSSRYSRRSKGSGGIVLFGLGLLVVGYTGVFFGNLIKAAVSRQREFLADASAVQYTRNPDGIAGALMKIATHANHSYLDNPKGEEISHALFEEGRVTMLRGLFATHPPLEKRISAILPRWDGSYDLVSSQALEPDADAAEPPSSLEQENRRERMNAVLTGAAGVIVADSLTSQVGNPDARHLQYADDVLHSIAPSILAAAREPAGARALIYLLVLDNDDLARTQQLEFLQQCADETVFFELENLNSGSVDITAEQRLPLVEIAIASLRQLSAPQYELFRRNFIELIRFDKKINLFEWAMQKIVLHHLDAVFDKRPKRRLGKRDIKRCADSCSVILSILVHSNSHQDIGAEEAFARGVEQLPMNLELKPVSDIQFEALNSALDELVKLKPLQKPMLLKACAAVIAADGKAQAIEVELMRAIADTIDCPMPPLLG